MKDFFMSKVMAMLIVTAIIAGMFSVSGNSVSAEKCEDITGIEKWGSESHGDNEPSTKEFKQILNDDSKGICALAECVDLMECKGSVTDWSDFKETTVYMGTTEEVQDCLKDRYELPDDDGDKHLADYEIQKCATGNY